MDLDKIRIRQDLERMVINYRINNDITEEQCDRLCGHIESVIGGGYYPKPEERRGRAIITFPTSYTGPKVTEEKKPVQEESPPKKLKQKEPNEPEIHAPYGEPVPEGITDYREALQRRGLVLLRYRVLTCNEGIFVNAKWAQSNHPTNRLMAKWSGPVPEEEIPIGMPLDNDHWCYYTHAERGKTALYTVFVAPEDVLEVPKTQFYDYIQSLKDAGMKNDFDYVFNFATEKRNRFLSKNKELTNLKLHTRFIHHLHRRKIHTVKGLQSITVQELQQIEGLGTKILTESLALLRKQGITLQMEPAENEIAY